MSKVIESMGRAYVPTKPGKKWESVKDILPPYSHYPSNLQSLNTLINQMIAYYPERVDYWQNANETLMRHAGDCEDFAILKYQILRSLGYDAQDLLIMVGWDNVLRTNHAVLCVLSKGKIDVLDCTTNVVIPWNRLTTLKPIMGYSGNQCWIFAEKAGN